MDIGLGMEPHLKGIARIVSQAGMDIVSIAATDGGRIWATYIDDDDGKQYTIDIRPDGKPRALKKFNQLNYSEEKENCKDGCKRNNQD